MCKKVSCCGIVFHCLDSNDSHSWIKLVEDNLSACAVMSHAFMFVFKIYVCQPRMFPFFRKVIVVRRKENICFSNL